MKLKRMMAIVLCFAMVLSTMSFSVFAEDATVTVSSYDELVAALTNAETETIELAGDITIDTSITVPDGVILDLKGNTLYVNVENSYYNNVTIKNGNIVLGKDDVHVCDGYFLVNKDKALVLSDVNMSSATDGIKGYAVFHLKTGANLDLIDSTLNISDNEYAAGYIVYAGESTATVDITGTTVTGTNVNGIVHATTVIDNSTFTIGDANEHGINRSAVTINDSTVTISGGTGRGITAEHGNLVISGDSVVNISDMGEATIELRGDKNLTVADTATVTVDVAVNNTTSGTIIGNVVLFEAPDPEGNIQVGYYTANYNNTGRHAIYGEATNVIGSESFVVELYSDDTLVGTSALVDTEKVLLNGNSKSISWHILLDAESDTDAWWDTEWVGGAMNIENLPNKVKLLVDGKEVSEGEIKLHSADNSFPVIAVVADENGDVQSLVTADGYVNNMKNVNNKFNAAVSAAESGSILAMVRAGSYFISTGNDITISGLVDGVEFDMGGAEPNMGSADVSFENVTFNWNPSVYHGLQYAGNMTYTNCEINGTVFLYGESETFNNCTFNVQDDAYNVWTYSAKKVDFNGCTFNSDGKSVLIYHEGATTFNDVTVTDCDFIANSSFEGKAAIEMDSSLTSGIKLTIDAATTATGFDAGNISGNNLWNNKMGNEGVNNDITIIVDGETVLKPVTLPVKVATKDELVAAIANSTDGDRILLTANIDYGTDQLKLDKPIILDLGGKTLTTSNAWGGMSVKNNPTIKNGTIVHASNTAAIKVWNATAFEDLVIDVQGKGDAGKTIGGIVLQSGTTTRVDSIKNVTIKGVALTNGIETYNCGDAAQDVIGSMENVTIDANGTGMLISAPCGTATNCDINGGKTGIEIWIKGNYSATLDLVNSNVTGGEQAVYAHDEFNTGVINSGDLEFTVDDKTTFSGGANGALLTVVNQHDSDLAVSDAVTEAAVAVTNGKYFDTLAKALTAANDGETVALIWEEGDAPIAMNGAVYGKTVTITGDATVDWSIGNLFVGRGGEGNGTVIFDNANLKSASNSSSYGIHVSGREKDTNNKYDGTLVINNSTIELDYLINKGTMALDNSTLTVKNGFSVGGRPASETESGVDTTATIDLKNGSKVVVNNHNGMGLGYEAIGVMNIDKTSAFECTQNFLITAKGTMNVNGGNVNVDGNLEVKGTLKSNGNVFGNIVAADTAVIELTGGLYTQDVTEWCADGYKCSATKDGKYMVYPDFTVEAIANVETAKAGDTITVQVKVTKGGNYTNADWVLKYDPRYVTYLGTDDKNYKISGKEYNGTPNDGYDEFDSDYALGTYTFTVNELTTEATAVFEIVDAHVHNYAMSIEFDGVEASKQNDIVAIKFKTADREIDTKTVPYNGMEQRGNGVADAPANATITYSKTEDFTNGTQLPPAFVNVGTHTYYAQIKLDGYATKVVEGTLVIEAKGVEPSVEWMVAPESDKVEFKPVIKGVVDGTFNGTVTVTGKKADGTEFKYNFDASDFTYNGEGKAVYNNDAEKITDIKGGELLEVTVKYTAGTNDNYKDGEKTETVYVNKSTIDDTTEAKLEDYIIGNDDDVVYDGNTHYVTVDNTELAKLGWTATVATHNGVRNYGDVEVVDVTFTDLTGKYNDYTATVLVKIIRREVTISVKNVTKKNGQADSEVLPDSYTVSPAIIGNDLGDINIVRANGETGEVEDTYDITATYTPNDNYIVYVNNGTLTITDAVYFVEVVDNAHNGNEVKYGADTKSDYTAGSVANGNIATKMILVHTDADYAFFTYKGEKMYDVTDAGYSYVNHNYAEGTHVTEKKYQHVYAIVVDAEYGDVTSEVIKDKYASHLAYEGKDATAAYAPVKVTYDADINDKSNLHTNDYSTVKGVYGGIYSNSRYQISILKADYNKDKIVNTADAIDVKNAVIGE